MRRLRLPILLCILAILLSASTLRPQGRPVEPAVVYDLGPRWFKGNLHTHSLWSDGDDFPEMIAEWYRRNGYDFLAMTDHNTLSQGPKWLSVALARLRTSRDALPRYRHRFGDSWVETRVAGEDLEVRLKPLNEFAPLVEQSGRFLLIQGEEITDRVGFKPVHINACNLLEPIAPRGGRSVAEAIAGDLEAVREQSRRSGRPMLAIVDHPRFREGITAEDLADVAAGRFFEVFNGHPDVRHREDGLHPSVERMWDIANAIRLGDRRIPPIYGLATDDAHHYFGGGAAPGRGWIMVRARHLTPESLIRAMEAGDFYASTGVTLRRLNYSASTRRLELEIEPEKDSRYTTRFLGTLKACDLSPSAPGGCDAVPKYSEGVGRVLATVEGTVASYVLTGEELYVRAVVTSTLPAANRARLDQFRQAWTQPVGWDRGQDRPGSAAGPSRAR